MSYPIQLSDEQWKLKLSPEDYAVLREAGTERAFTGELLHEDSEGVFRCKACDASLFESGTKFDSGSGWPSFYAPVNADAVELVTDRSWGMKRVEVLCANCGSHLGHVFDDAWNTPTGDRYCMNSASLSFDSKE